MRSSRRKPLGFILVVLILGALIGSAMGEILGLILPAGVVRQFFLKAITGGFSPVTLNAVMFTITFGFSIKLNVIGIVGIAIAAYILRWY